MTTLLTINLPPVLEEDLVDYILSLEGFGGFTSYLVMGHGEDEKLSIAEQVAGRQKRVQFELLIEEEAVADLVGGLASNVGEDITYWQTPVTGIGRT